MKQAIDFGPKPIIAELLEDSWYITLWDVESILEDALMRTKKLLESIWWDISQLKPLYERDVIPEMEKYIVWVELTAQRILREFEQ